MMPPKQTGAYLCSSVLTLFFSQSLKKEKENVFPSKILHAISRGSQALCPTPSPSAVENGQI